MSTQLPTESRGEAAGARAESSSPASSGQVMPEEVRGRMERSFGADFSGVRVHEGPEPHAVGALAYTRGTDIHFAPGLYSPHSTPGQELLGHELAHVVQQSQGRVPATSQRKGMPSNSDPALEREADEAGRRAALGEDAPSSFRGGIQDFQRNHSAESIRDGQARVLGQPAAMQGKDSSGVLQAYGGGPFAAPTGKKTTNLAGLYGSFKVDHGLTRNPTDSASGEYEIEIFMKPNLLTMGSNIRFVQTVRRGTTPGNWSTRATDSGMTADRAKRVAGEGWRVDRADPSTDRTPFYGHSISSAGALTANSNARPGSWGGNDVYLYDGPAVLDPSVLEFASNAMDDQTGQSFGVVGWGFQYASATRTYIEETPRLLSVGDSRVEGQRQAYEKWNQIYGASGTVDKNVRTVPIPSPGTGTMGPGDFPMPSGDTRYA